MAINLETLKTLDIKSMIVGAILMAAISGTPVYFKYDSLEVRLAGARKVAEFQAKAVAMAQSNEKVKMEFGSDHPPFEETKVEP